MFLYIFRALRAPWADHIDGYGGQSLEPHQAEVFAETKKRVAKI
jgi:hypothetical protein